MQLHTPCSARQCRRLSHCFQVGLVGRVGQAAKIRKQPLVASLVPLFVPLAERDRRLYQSGPIVTVCQHGLHERDIFCLQLVIRLGEQFVTAHDLAEGFLELFLYAVLCARDMLAAPHGSEPAVAASSRQLSAGRGKVDKRQGGM